MLNYYQILGISKSATHSEIKSAFKRLALKYHPDKNPENTAAEEYFKQVNEAYQILSDEDKRKRYDFLLSYSSAQSTTTFTQHRPARPGQPKKEKSVYDRYGAYNWRTAPKYKEAPTYKVDKNYFKIQVITLGAMILLSVAIIAMNKFWAHMEDQKKLKIAQQNEAALNEAQQLFDEGKYRLAIDQIIQLDQKNPFESTFYNEKERMITTLWNSASSSYQQALYEDAITKLEVVKDYERPMKLKTWNMLAEAYYRLADYEKALMALDRVFERDKNNMRLVVRMARIYNKNLNNPEKALVYYDEAKLLFKELQSSTYGEAFELIVKPNSLPDFYHELFQERARLNLKTRNYEEAMTDYNWAIFLRPAIAENYFMRASCKRNLGLNERACLDWQRALERGHLQSRSELNKYCQ
ncbi:hypothetical protein E1176_11615 [Fulvivirga sp. RKSG066]|uniref:DnaJ domain-containing protein n=1 Tax=Fulvivirga aurantia TaxID=2529383 RepID=UPI0012BB8681|nr:DnaJ domain-containing protein [Fulvivirga aurantia]MTI21669.1 hypothetical protein [Fulvivirga aurantia]